MRVAHQKYEARDFAWDLSFYQAYGDPQDKIWAKIISEAKQAKQGRQHSFHAKIPHEYPFIQGDQIAQGLPDVIYECDEYVMGIEIFQFDASGKNRNGSKMKIAELEADRKANLKIRETPSRPLNVEEPVNTTFSYAGYVQSLTNTFKDHAQNIERYIEKLKLHFPNKKVYFSFFIEDITAIGSYIVINGERFEMMPVYVREFINLIEQYRGIDYLIFKTQDFYIKSINIYKISHQAIEELKRCCYNMNESSFYQYNYKRATIVHSATEHLDGDPRYEE